MPGGAVRQRDLEHADLRRGGRPDLAAERIREQLMAEADAEERHGARHTASRIAAFSSTSQGCSASSQTSWGPPMTQSASKPGEVRDRLAEIQPHGLQRDAVPPQEIPEDAGMARLHVLEDENTRHAHGPSGASGSYRSLARVVRDAVV